MKIPSSPRKRYLGGADWCIAALNKGTASLTGRKCMFQIAVFLDGVPDGERVEASFKAFCARFPVLWGTTARCWCLAPYWRTPPAPDPFQPVRIGRSLPPGASRQTVVRHIETLVNRHAARLRWTAALDSVCIGNTHCVLVFSFDHRIFDAAGAEAFINLFLRQTNGSAGDAEFPPPRPAAPAGLSDRWREKFKSGQKVNRMMRSLARGETCWLPLPPDAIHRPFRFRVEYFTPEEAQRIRGRAFDVAGYLMLTPYLLATAAAVFHPVFRAQAAGPCNFVVSVSTARPQTQAPPRRLFFNDLSFLYFQFPLDAATDRDTLAVTLREQLIRQGRDGVPAAIEDGNLLMRILPARWYWRFLMRFYRNRLSSFGFTGLGESTITEPAVLGCPVRERIHFPVIPTPPGIGLVLDQSGGGYHFILSYIEGILSEKDAAALMANIRASLL